MSTRYVYMYAVVTERNSIYGGTEFHRIYSYQNVG